MEVEFEGGTAYVDDQTGEVLDREMQSAIALALEESVDEPGLQYASSEEWFEKWLAFVYRRDTSVHGSLWCPQWWKHPEARVRIEALWRAWEAHMRADPMVGLTAWFVNYADPHMGQLMSPDGPFKGCSSQAHRERREDNLHLPMEPIETAYLV